MGNITKNVFLVVLFLTLGMSTTMGQADNRTEITRDIQLVHLKDSIFVHTTWHHLEEYGRFPSNGMIIIRNGEALMIDTPMDNNKTESLVKYLKDSLSVKVTKLIIGHFHDDCLGGLEYLQSIGVESIANSRTIAKCIDLGLPVPTTSFTEALNIDFNGEQIECRFFGAGHSFDNITVWIPGKKILFGGCLVKSANSRGLGNLSDAVVEDWVETLRKVMTSYPEAETVVPGHGDPGSLQLVTHTIQLVEMETGN